MSLVSVLIDFKNPVFHAFAQWSVLLALKMMYMSLHTAFLRFKKQVYIWHCDQNEIATFFFDRIKFHNFHRHLPMWKTVVESVFDSMTQILNVYDGNKASPTIIFFPFIYRLYTLIDFVVFTICSGHRNDIENILPAFIIGFIYVLIDPNPLLGCLLFKLAAIARFIHTLVYVIIVVPQPARVLAFSVQFLITIYMGACILLHFFWKS